MTGAPGKAVRAFTYIDGFNLYYGMLKGRKNRRWLDPVALSKLLLPRANVEKVRYFTARVKDFDGSGAHQRQDVYLRALATLTEVECHFGSFRVDAKQRKLVRPAQSGERFATVWIPEEKGSDVNLASHLVLDAALDRFDTALVITNDSDLAEPVRLVVHELEKRVILVHPSESIAGALANVGPTQAIPLWANTVLKSQLPDPVVGVDGRSIRKPSTW